MFVNLAVQTPSGDEEEKGLVHVNFLLNLFQSIMSRTGCVPSSICLQVYYTVIAFHQSVYHWTYGIQM